MRVRFSFGTPGWSNPKSDGRIVRVYYDSEMPQLKTADGIASTLVSIARVELKTAQVELISWGQA